MKKIKDNKYKPKRAQYGAYLGKQASSISSTEKESSPRVQHSDQKFKYEEGDMIRQLRLIKEDWIEEKGFYYRKNRDSNQK
jgi:hypothetical protein